MEDKKSTYTEAQKKATKKYRENNKDKVKEQRKTYYQRRKDRDPGFLEYKRLNARKYYNRKKNKQPIRRSDHEMFLSSFFGLMKLKIIDNDDDNGNGYLIMPNMIRKKKFI